MHIVKAPFIWRIRTNNCVFIRIPTFTINLISRISTNLPKIILCFTSIVIIASRSRTTSVFPLPFSRQIKINTSPRT